MEFTAALLVIFLELSVWNLYQDVYEAGVSEANVLVNKLYDFPLKLE
ncbi:hypothetical protein [Simplicispira suum]|nr:hypothetical protein [Simplicispira suum]